MGAFRGFVLALVLAVTAACGTSGSSAPGTSPSGGGDKGGQILRVAYQKSGTLMVLKARGTLEKRLGSLGWSVQWAEFSTGLDVLQALGSGSADIGIAGDAPSIFAEARGLAIEYLAAEPPSPRSEGILVHKDALIHRVADLKGKKVAFNKASISQYLLDRALKAEGLSLPDIQPVYLAPPDARAAFEQGSADAWVVWDPFFAAAEQSGGRVLRDATGLTAYRTFYLGAKGFASAHPDVVKAVVEEIQHTDDDIRKNPDQAAQVLAEATKLDPGAWKLTLKREELGVTWMDQKAVDDQQKNGRRPLPDRPDPQTPADPG
ncbi:MAG: aliphatic sulfonate ABC transporter substrate-binding protein [Kyrpidia sp.]|nr:aliphatic sulfonate ABC transporter substrate-binding protein [Kyrpidia sp.]